MRARCGVRERNPTQVNLFQRNGTLSKRIRCPPVANAGIDIIGLVRKLSPPTSAGREPSTSDSAQDERLHSALASVFGFGTFRPLQQEVVRAILAGHDVFALMPTGGGKSLCYQLPALLQDGITVVVSPLIALMKDQVDAMRALGVKATYINSSLDASEQSRRQAAVARGEMTLLYVAPERLMMPGFLRLLQGTSVSLFAIDEAHCISEWGHDFRPEYRELRRLRELFPKAPVAAFTATATRRVQADILSQLQFENAVTFRGSFNRSNLFYEVLPRKDAYAQLVRSLRNRPHQSGIIYCSTRAATEDLEERLRLDGVPAAAYHAGLESDERRRRQDAFIRDDVPIIIATVAFGMGIDKPDVRFVIHFDMPRTLENYYQESGRAGRDGERSDCILFFSPGDIVKLRRFVDEKRSAAERHAALWQLQQMADWAESSTCRRRLLLAYFDEAFEGQDAPCCDVCLSPPTEEDATTDVQKFLSCVMRTRERFGAGHIIDVLRGSRNERVLRFSHHNLSTYGIGRDRSEESWRHLARELLRRGFLRQDPEAYNALKVTDQGRNVLFAGEMVTVASRRRPSRNADVSEASVHTPLFDRLRELRKRLADEEGVPPYVILHDRSLRHMAAALPTTAERLRGIPGVGQHKITAYGPRFVQVISEYVEETGAQPQQDVSRAVPGPPLRGGLSSTIRETLRLFRAGQDLLHIARARSLSPTTIEGHLVTALEAGEDLDSDRLVPPSRREAIEAAFRVAGTEYLTPVLETLGDGYTYDQLRMVRAIMRGRDLQSNQVG